MRGHPARKGGGKQVTEGRNCQVSGTGLQGGVAGVVAMVLVRCRDAQDRWCSMGGDIVLVSVKPNNGPAIDAHVIDNTDGSYTCSYLPTVATQHCKVTVTVNGAHVVGSPFAAQVTPGPTNAIASEVFGRGLYDGVAGQTCHFGIQTKDVYGNLRTEAGDRFCVSVQPVQSLLPELATFFRKYEVTPQIVDNEDGTHACSFSCDHAGFYKVEVILGSVPVGESPYHVLICNPTVAVPAEIALEPATESLPLEDQECPRACDILVLMNELVMVKSEPIERTGGRPSREYVYSHRLSSLVSSEKAQWRIGTIRSQLPNMMPPPYRRQCLGLDTALVAVCHNDWHGELTPITEVRKLNMADHGKTVPGWQVLEFDTSARPPNAVEGYATAAWENRSCILFSGGTDKDGKVTSDIWLLTLGGSNSCVASWRALAEWPSSIFSGEGARGLLGTGREALPCVMPQHLTQSTCVISPGFPARMHHSMTFRPSTSTFWIFGGRGASGELLSDLCMQPP